MTPPETKRQKIGRWGEELATQDYIRRGYQIIARNVRTPYGEIDLIASNPSAFVFVEVKTRTTDLFGPPEVSMTAQKQAHLQNAIQAYLQDHPEICGDWRIDVVSIQGTPDRPGESPEIVVFENAIS